jgi:uncharacterized membrane protein
MPPTFKPPIKLLLIDIIGTILAAIGIAALVTDLSVVSPVLANRDVAGIIALIGCAMMTYGLGMIVRLIMRRPSAPTPPPK